MKNSLCWKVRRVSALLLGASFLLAGAALAQVPAKTAAPVAAAAKAPLPKLVRNAQNRYELLVDGAPYLILGTQVNNSSAWPSQMAKVWPAIDALHANTVEMPVYWEQFEPQPGKFDTSIVDALLAQAREHKVRLVLLWFGTWKNASGHYWPEWMKTDEAKYPHLMDEKGKLVDSPSPFAPATLQADIHAFTALMRHLKQVDAQHTVIMVQVENEAGTWNSIRDYSPAAQKVFAEPVPESLLKGLHLEAKSGGNWQAVFGDDADEFFHAWAVAHYIEQVAVAGKAVNPLPMYANAALRDPFHPAHPANYETGGPSDNVLDLWKATAPSLDLLAPDIYLSQSESVNKVISYYHRPDNALFVPEMGNKPEFSRYFFTILGNQGIGLSPFGLDYTGFENSPLGACKVDSELVDTFALNYRLVGSFQSQLAQWSFEGKVYGVSEEAATHAQTLDLGTWQATVSYGLGQFGPGTNPPGNKELKGRALIVKLDENEYLVTGAFARVDFAPKAAGRHLMFLKVEEGHFVKGVFQAERIWNGDQSDWGLNLTEVPRLLRVRLSTY